MTYQPPFPCPLAAAPREHPSTGTDLHQGAPPRPASAWTDRFKVRTSPALRTALEGWLAAEAEPMTRLEALRVADAVCRLAEQIRDQRVIEARSFRHTWTEVAAVVGVTRQSAHRRWRGLDGHADALAAERQRQYRPRPLPAAAPPVQPPLSDEGDWNAWRPGLEG